MLSTQPAETQPPSNPPDPPSRPPHPSYSPFHPIPGLSNFRDIGGWPTTRPHTSIRTGILFRGSDTNRITPAGISKLHDLGIETDFDLRSAQQIEKTGGYREMEGIERRWTPVFVEGEYTEEKARRRYELYASEGVEGIVKAFVEILTAGAEMFRTVLRHLLATVPAPGFENPVPALFMHCTTGNNRTGVFISLLLLLLGVPVESVVEEYALSEEGLAPTRHVNVERLLKKGAFEKYGPEKAREKCERMVGARPESMRALIAEVEKKWGGAEGYFRGIVGLKQEEIEGLKNVLIVTDDGPR
ncbi:hypothetical protein M011DRAFT_409818 [Sporormia fimetaria CBS 119925]|uniref:Tyrosine specific protein phosphatases domain-containing protein n=1 Tax=Sporormia fimetaria CBS 119925 TaxID=1340428 RepID=A0A6A6V262_9PLEO|nr:hypothetical protein M011DRAFT_409818 [Sporormia fimetaria CBS 119925]